MPPSIYTHLAPGQIRLLTPLHHSIGTVWQLRTFSLDDTELNFDALSYTWGSQAETFPIVCNEKLFFVHHNLYSALPYLARRQGNANARPIWIDAVCINQSDELEKGVQMRLMHRIYQRAEKVWAWLGGMRSLQYVV